MSVSLHARARAEMLTGLARHLAGGSLRLYAGVRPKDPKDPPQSTLLASLGFQDPASEKVKGGVLTLKPCVKNYAVGTGHAHWFRCVNRMGLAVLDGDCGEHGDLTLQRSWIEAGDEIEISGLAVSL